MKQYKLKKWYPSLAISWRTDDRYEYDAYRQVMINISNVKNGVALPKEMIVKKQELHPDFWELIEEKKPLFVTEDGVEVLNPEDWIYLVNPLFEKIERYARNSNINTSKEIIKVFYYEANADDYILMNKPVFSYNDIKKFQSGGDGTWWNVKAIAKERSK